MKERKANLASGPVGPTLFRMTVPMFFGMLSMVLLNLTDCYFVGKLGTIELAALGFTFPVVIFGQSIALGLGIGTSSTLARLIGRGDSDRVRRVATHSLILSLAVVGVFCVLGLYTIEPLFRAIGTKETTLPFVKEYMEVWYIGLAFVVIPMVGNHAIRSTGDMKIPGLIMIGAAAINIVLDPIFIFGRLGIPAMGVRGAAVATVIARACSLVASLLVLHFREHMLELSRMIFHDFFRSCREVLYVGLPAAALQVLVPLTMGYLTRIVSEYGEETVAAVGTGIKIEAFALMPFFALATAAIAFTGQNFGAGKLDRIRTALNVSIKFGVFWSLLSLVVFLIAAPWIAPRFSDDPAVIERMIIYLRIVAGSYGMLGLCIVIVNMFNGLRKPLDGALMTVVRVLAMVIPFISLGHYWGGFQGTIIGLCLANLGAGIIATVWLKLLLGRMTAKVPDGSA